LLIVDSKPITGTLVPVVAPAGIPSVPAGTTSVPEGTSPAPVGATTQFLMSPCDLSIMVAVFVLINLLLMLIPALTAAAVMKSSLAVAMKVDATFILRYLPLPRLMTQALHLHECISMTVVMPTVWSCDPLHRAISLSTALNRRCHTMDRPLERTFLLIRIRLEALEACVVVAASLADTTLQAIP
jgi:hypothetical protein